MSPATSGPDLGSAPALTLARYRHATARAETFRLLADPTRVTILSLLAEQPRFVGALVGALAVALAPVSPPTQPVVSHHLALLRLAGLLAPTRSGRYITYHLTPRGQRLAAALDAAD